jgi:hypothetical protein
MKLVDEKTMHSMVVFERYTRWRFGHDGSPSVSLLPVMGLIDVPMERAELEVCF